MARILGVIPDELLYQCSREYVTMLSDCSTDRVIQSVKEYIDDENNNSEYRTFLSQCFMFQLLLLENRDDDILKGKIQELCSIQFEDINENTKTDKLEEYNKLICNIVDNEYCVPYISLSTRSTLNDVLSKLKDSDNKCDNILYRIVKGNSRFFVQSRVHANKGTIFKLVAKNGLKLEIIRKAIEFQLRMREQNIPKERWLKL